MANNAIKWETTSTDRNGLTTELNSLANNAISSLGSEIDNSTNLDKYGWIRLSVTFGTSPSDTNPTVDIYIAEALDGTNYGSSPVTGGAQQDQMLLVRVPVRKVTSAQVIDVRVPGYIPPHKLKLAADNQTGQAFPSSGSTVDLYTNNDEIQ